MSYKNRGGSRSCQAQEARLAETYMPRGLLNINDSSVWVLMDAGQSV